MASRRGIRSLGIKKILLYGIIVGVFFLLPQPNYAVTVSIDEPIPTISSEPFIITVHITGAQIGTNYLKIDLYKDDSINYFGETYNGTDWYNGNDGTQYLPITIQTGIVWQGQVSGRLGSPTTNEYDGDGQYKLRVRRYTQSGYNSSEALANAVNITITIPSTTPTPTIIPTPTPLTETVQPTPTQTPTILPISYNNIFISEIMPNPDNDEKEWVEIFNNNDFSVSLYNWYIDDEENAGSSPKPFSAEIGAKSYFVFELSSYFNNDGDSVRLLDFSQIEKDRFSYESTVKGKTYGRVSFSNNNFCLQSPTKGAVNNHCIETTPSATPTQKPTPTPTTGLILSLSEEITPTSPSPTQTITDLYLEKIIVDSIPVYTEATLDIVQLPHDSVLGVVTDYANEQKQTQAKNSVLGLSLSSTLISLLNIANIFRKIILRVTS